MIVYLAELRPALASSGAEQVLRFSSDPRWTRADGVDWLPTLAVPYRRNTQVFDGQFQSQPQDYGQLEFAVSKGQPISPLTAMVWDGRPVKIWKGQRGQATSAMTVVFDGTSEAVSGKRSRVVVKLNGPNVNLPLLKTLYAGTGAAEGPADLKNAPKPLLLGTATNLEPQYVNRSLGIFQYHGYGAAGGVTAVYDSGSQLGTSVGDYADYAALAAATVPVGRYATCNALGMGRHGGDITGVLTIDAQGAVTAGLPGAIIKWVLRTHQGLSAAKVKEDSLDWLDTQLPYPQDIYVTDQIDTEEFCKQLMLSLGGYVWWTEAGQFTVGLVRRGGAAASTLGRQNIQDTPQLRETNAPLWKRSMGWGRSWRVHSYSEVRTPKEITPRGTWSASPSPVYQYYDMVDWANASWIYIASVAGNTATPGTNAAVWQYFRSNGAAVVESTTTPTDPQPGVLWRNPTTGVLRTYLSGTWVTLADVTSLNTAAAIAGQGALATANTANWTTQIANRPLVSVDAVSVDELTSDLGRWVQLVTGHWSAIPTPTPRYSMTAFRTQAGETDYLRGLDVPLDPNGTYALEGWLTSVGGNGSTYTGVTLKNSAGAIFDNFSGFYFGGWRNMGAAGASPQQIFIPFGAGTDIPFPAGAVTMAPAIFANISGTAGYVVIEGLRITRLSGTVDWVSRSANTTDGNADHYALTATAAVKCDWATAWNSAAVTRRLLASIRVRGTPLDATNDVFLGLGTSLTLNSWGVLRAFYYSGGGLSIWELGSNVQSLGTYSTPPALEVEYDGGSIRYIVNGSVVRTTAVGSGLTMCGALLANQPRAGFSALSVGPAVNSDYSIVTGTTRPENNATLGDNRIRNANMVVTSTDTWWGTLTRTAGVAANSDPLFYARTTSAGGGAGAFNGGVNIPVVGNETLYCSALVRSQSGLTNNIVRFNPFFYDAAGAFISQATSDVQANSTTWKVGKTTFTVPANAATMVLNVAAFCNSGTSCDLAMPRVGATEYLADVTSTAQITTEIVQDYTVGADYLGTVDSTALAGILWSPKVLRGGTVIKVDNGTTYSLSGATGGTFAVDNTNGSSSKGDVTISAMSANTASVDLSIFVNGILQTKYRLSLSKIVADPPPPSGSSSSRVTWALGEMQNVTNTSYVALVSPVKTVTLATGQKIYANLNYDYYISGLGGAIRYGTVKAQYAVAGSGSWNDVGAAVNGGTSAAAVQTGPPDYEVTEAEPGNVVLSQSTGVLSAGNYDVRFVMKVDQATRTLVPSALAQALMEAKV